MNHLRPSGLVCTEISPLSTWGTYPVYNDSYLERSSTLRVIKRGWEKHRLDGGICRHVRLIRGREETFRDANHIWVWINTIHF